MPAYTMAASVAGVSATATGWGRSGRAGSRLQCRGGRCARRRPDRRRRRGCRRRSATPRPSGRCRARRARTLRNVADDTTCVAFAVLEHVQHAVVGETLVERDRCTAESGDQACHEHVTLGGDAQRGRPAARAALRGRGAHLGEHCLRAPQELRSFGVSDRAARAARALHEARAGERLQRAQLLADCRLHVTEAAGCRDERRLLGDRLEAQEMAELDAVPLARQRYGSARRRSPTASPSPPLPVTAATPNGTGRPRCRATPFAA